MRGLYAIVDPDACLGRDPVEVAQAILRGGCAALQLRAKQLDDETFVALARRLHDACRQAQVPFVVNDRAGLVPRVGARALHLGQADLSIEAARALLGPEVVIGLSTHTVEQARDAERRGADMIGFGPVFPTTSKQDASTIVGPSGLAAACASVSIPVVAIGGIRLQDAPAIRGAGAPLLAAISAVCAAQDPESAARALHTAMREGRADAQ